MTLEVKKEITVMLFYICYHGSCNTSAAIHTTLPRILMIDKSMHIVAEKPEVQKIKESDQVGRAEVRQTKVFKDFPVA